MIQHFYSNISDGKQVECNNPKHYKPDPIYLLKSNYLSEFRTSLERKKARQNLGIGDAQTLEWGHIQGDIAEQTDISAYIESLLKFTSALYPEIGNVRDAAIKSLEFLSTFEGEKEAIDKLNLFNKLILFKLYGVETIEEVDLSTGGILNQFQESLGNFETYIQENNDNIDEIINLIDSLEGSMQEINELLENINNQINISTDKTNAIKTDHTHTIVVDGEELQVNDGLYVKDLEPTVNKNAEDISGINDKINVLLGKVDLANDKFVTKQELGGGDFNFVKTSDLNNRLLDYAKLGDPANFSTLKTTQVNSDTVITTDSGFKRLDGPVDVNTWKPTLEALRAIDPSECYEGMGVIVASEHSLYILNNPEHPELESSWTCAQDLVIKVMTQAEYDALAIKNPDFFYYIVEEEKEAPKLPNEEDYPEDAEGYQAALEQYELDKLNYLLYLSEQYLSAAWGLQIDLRISNIASTYARSSAVTSLEGALREEIQRIDDIIGGLGSNSIQDQLLALADEDVTIKRDIQTILESIGTGGNIATELGTIKADILTNSDNIETNSNNILSIQEDLSGKADKNSDAPFTSVIINTLTLGGKNYTKVPKIEYVTEEEFNNITEKDPEVYYFIKQDETENNDLRYVSYSEVATLISGLQTIINNLSAKITTLEGKVETLEGKVEELEQEEPNTNSEP